MTDTIVVFIPMLFAFALLYWGSQLEEDDILRLIFQALVIPLFWLSVHLATIFSAVNYAAYPEIVETLANFTNYTSYLLYVWGIIYLFKIVKAIYDMIQANLSNKKQERYGDND